MAMLRQERALKTIDVAEREPDTLNKIIEISLAPLSAAAHTLETAFNVHKLLFILNMDDTLDGFHGALVDARKKYSWGGRSGYLYEKQALDLTDKLMAYGLQSSFPADTDRIREAVGIIALMPLDHAKKVDYYNILNNILSAICMPKRAAAAGGGG